MEYKKNFEEIIPYYEAFWNCEILNKPAFLITAPGNKHYQYKFNWSCWDPKNVFNYSSEQILDAFEDSINNTFFGGLAIPFFWPNFGPDVFSGFLGTPIKFSEDSQGTSWIDWSFNALKSYDDLSCLSIKEENPFYKKNIELIKMAVERAHGKFIVGATDLHGGFDSLSVLRNGPDKACLDVIENADGVKSAMRKLFDVWKKIYDDYYDIVKDKQKGTTSWINIWNPSGKMYPVQSDLSCLVSSSTYKESLLEEILSEIEYLDYSIYHLDGVEALQHLDILLDISRLNAIQWVRGARFDSESIEKWFPLYKKIQEKKKSIVVYPKINEIDLVLKNLKPEGLFIQMHVSSEEEAKQIMKKVGW
jgi:hypothetical protein